MQTLTILCLLGFTLASKNRMGSDNVNSDIVVLRSGNLQTVSLTGNKVTEVLSEEYGDRYFYFPDSEDNIHLIDSLEPVNKHAIKLYSSANNSYHLYTRFNKSPQFLVYDDEDSVRNSFFDPSKETVFFSHGWTGDGYTKNGKLITEAFLRNNDVNVIQFDWSYMAKQCYTTSVYVVPKVGKLFGMFITWLTSFGLNYENIHLIGFSLGGHVVGNAGRATQGKIRRITALDPAGPLWRFNNNRLVRTDAQYVEVIHTNIRAFGFPLECGDADFYPNGGILIPGCITNICCHNRAVEYMASTVKWNHLIANECESSWDMLLNNCHGAHYPMGNSDLSKSRPGLYRVNTKANYPF